MRYKFCLASTLVSDVSNRLRFIAHPQSKPFCRVSTLLELRLLKKVMTCCFSFLFNSGIGFLIATFVDDDTAPHGCFLMRSHQSRPVVLSKFLTWPLFLGRKQTNRLDLLSVKVSPHRRFRVKESLVLLFRHCCSSSLVFSAIKQPTTEQTNCFLFPPGPVYSIGHVRCADYFWNGAKTLVWTDTVFVSLEGHFKTKTY